MNEEHAQIVKCRGDAVENEEQILKMGKKWVLVVSIFYINIRTKNNMCFTTTRLSLISVVIIIRRILLLVVIINVFFLLFD